MEEETLLDKRNDEDEKIENYGAIPSTYKENEKSNSSVCRKKMRSCCNNTWQSLFGFFSSFFTAKEDKSDSEISISRKDEDTADYCIDSGFTQIDHANLCLINSLHQYEKISQQQASELNQACEAMARLQLDSRWIQDKFSNLSLVPSKRKTIAGSNQCDHKSFFAQASCYPRLDPLLTPKTAQEVNDLIVERQEYHVQLMFAINSILAEANACLSEASASLKKYEMTV